MQTHRTYLTTADKARQLGISEKTLRRRAEAGEIPGALQLWRPRGPWRFPAEDNENAPRRSEERARGVSADNQFGVVADLISARPTSVGATLTADAMRVSAHLGLVSTRPARAAAAMLAPLVAIASRHFRNRDGWCACCGTQHPCADYLDAAAGIEGASAVVLDGAA